ncbi:MAG: response regulator, partial [candidate division Zixibacteria bacterium]|nr:response regulator [candidate division Zixibacteria bacterium]
ERKRAEEKLKDYTHQIEEKNLELKAKNLELTATRAQLVQKEKLRALGQMASGVAHDFNNLLSIILGRAQLLQRKAKDLETEKGLRSIERAALDASSTIKRIQDFARVRKDQEFKWVNLDEVIEDVIALTKTKWKDQPEANGSTIELEVQKDRRRLPPVAGDESELREAFTSIVFNAVEAMPNGGKIVIRTRTNRKSVFVYFIDSGIGISEEAKQKIFDPFFTTKGVKNTGLGLSVAYGIIQRHQGDIQIEGKQGKGTTVIVRLPVSEILGQEEPKEKESEKPPVQRESANILVIEDEQDVRELLFDILTSANYMVKLASGGAGGLEIYKREKFDIVFTDLGMPRMSGWEVAKAIKEIDSNTTVLLITGWGVEMDEEKLKESRIDRVVAKPIKVESLLTLVSEIMESKKRAKEPVEGFGGTKA